MVKVSVPHRTKSRVGLINKCPKCSRSRIEVVDHKFTSDCNGIVIWCVCESCYHKWKELYDFQLRTTDMPWKKPPNNKEWAWHETSAHMSRVRGVREYRCGHHGGLMEQRGTSTLRMACSSDIHIHVFLLQTWVADGNGWLRHRRESESVILLVSSQVFAWLYFFV